MQLLRLLKESTIDALNGIEVRKENIRTRSESKNSLKDDSKLNEALAFKLERKTRENSMETHATL